MRADGRRAGRTSEATPIPYPNFVGRGIKVPASLPFKFNYVEICQGITLPGTRHSVR